MYLATLVCPISMPILRSSPWIRGAPHNELAMLISRISLRISGATVGRPPRRRDFHRQYDLNPARCHLITVSGLTIAKAPSTFGAKRYKPANIRRSKHPERRPFRRFPLQHVKLMTQNHVFSLKRGPRPERSDQRQPDQATKLLHRQEHRSI